MNEGLVVANGIRIFYVEEGEGPLVLFCHGFPESWYSWRAQLGPIAEAGFRAVAIDLPGYGRSDKPDVTYDIEFLSVCLAGVIQGLGHEKAVVAGHDWGGLIAWPFARLYPERVAGVIGLNVPDLPRYDMPPTELFEALGSDKTSYILFFQQRGQPEEVIEADVDSFLEKMMVGGAVKKEAFSDEVLRVFAEGFRPKGAITPPLEYYRNMDRNWELMEPHDDKKIEVPCLMICAAGDPVLPPSLADQMEGRVLEYEVVTIEDCGHWTQQEQPEITNEHMLRYLRRLPTWS